VRAPGSGQDGRVLLAAVAVLVGATVQAATGSGLAQIAGPALVAVLAPAEAVSTLIVLATVTTLLLLLVRRRAQRAVRWADARALLLAGLPGVAAGVLVLAVVARPVLQVVVGLGVLAAVAFQLRPRALAGPPPRPWTTAAVGVVAGLLTTTTGTNGPPLVLWLERRRATPEQTRDTLGVLFLGLNLLGALALAVAGRAQSAFRPDVLAVLLAAAVVGHAAGRWLFHLLDARRFRAAALAVSALAGLASLVAGAAAVLA
jgi:uncharacterized membrane protein YfcA